MDLKNEAVEKEAVNLPLCEEWQMVKSVAIRVYRVLFL